MMDVLTTSNLHDLVSADDGRCVSMYMPTYPVGREGQQDAVRLKNLVSAAEQQLIAQGMRGVAARELLQPILELPHEPATWGQRQRGLAIFRSEKIFINYWLATPLDEAVIVGRRFHVKRLLPAISAHPHFFVLAVSRNQVRLLKAKWHGFERLELPGLSTSMEVALNLQGADRGEQVHSGMRGDLGKEAGVFHGQGGHRDTIKEEVVEYFRMIDESLRPVLRENPWPLILAGVEYELAMFREVSDYSHIADETLCGSFDYVTDQELYAQALQLAQTISNQERRQALAKYHALADTNLASNDIEAIVPAAHEGRINTLFVDHHAEKYGRFCAEKNCIELIGQPDPALDLVDLATAQTILHKGTAYAANPDELPSGVPLCAVYRY